MLARFVIRNGALRTASRFYSEGAGHQSASGSAASQPPPDVPGLSSACVHPATQPVGPGVDPNKSGAYKVPEYFCYDASTFSKQKLKWLNIDAPSPLH